MPDDGFLNRLNALADATRMRILYVLEQHELGVGEIAAILQLPQSTISRHLKHLLACGWVVKRAVGTSSMYRLMHDSLAPDAAGVWSIAREQVTNAPTALDDLARAQSVLRERQTDTRAFFGRLGGEWDELRKELFGETFTAESLLGLLNPEWIVADIGCGTGNAAELLAPNVAQVIAIDREAAMLKAARKRLAHVSNVDFRQGELDDLPVETASIDAAIIYLVLHHINDPAVAFREVGRALRPGGVMLVVDMVEHDREAFRHTMGHVHLGFAEGDITRWARAAGFTKVHVHRLRPETAGKGPGLFAASVWKPR